MKIKIVIGLACLMALFSCQNSRNGDGDKIIASIYEKNLYQSDLQSIMYEGISYNDSIVKTKAFIHDWIIKQILVHEAESTIDNAELLYSKQIEDYRNSLIIYKYESLYVEQNLDTVIREEDIEKFVKENSPQNMDRETIRLIILNMRKKELIETMNNNLYNKAVRERIFKIY